MREIRTTSDNGKTPFSRWNIARESAVEFSEEPTFRMNGKDVSIKDTVNANAVDCNIYEVIEKYRGDLKMSQVELNQFHNELSAELMEIKSLPDAVKQIQKAEEAWRNVPLEIRKDFGNSLERFMKHGQTYLTDKINKYNQELENKRLYLEQLEKQNQTQVQDPNINQGVIL